MDAHYAGAEETTLVFDEVEASLHHAHLGLQALMDLLEACPPSARVQAQSMHMLLQPVVDQLSQAAEASRLVRIPS